LLCSDEPDRSMWLTSSVPPAGRLSGVSIRDLDPSSLGCIGLIPTLQRRQTNQPHDSHRQRHPTGEYSIPLHCKDRARYRGEWCPSRSGCRPLFPVALRRRRTTERALLLWRKTPRLRAPGYAARRMTQGKQPRSAVSRSLITLSSGGSPSSVIAPSSKTAEPDRGRRQVGQLAC
jgi:hypothetical protein